ncbi:MAG: hypothetical protein K2M69_08915 [Muribaculaceae bacterium]|nr:hypothetical protein [Muribaculaceae bacterium]
MRTSKYIALLLGCALLGGCDEGKIYPSESDGTGAGYNVVMTGDLKGSAEYGSGYSLVLAVFEEGDDFAEISKGVEVGSGETELSNVTVTQGTVELCVVNTLRKRVLTLATMQVNDQAGGETLRFDVGDVDVSAFGIIADRIFATTCLQCHGGTSHAAAGLDFNREKAWAMLVNVPSNVVEGMMRVAPDEPRRSTLWEAVATDASAGWSFNHSNLLPSEQSGFIEKWIEKGAEK